MTDTKIQGVKGMPDVLPPQAARMRHLEETAARVFGRAGFAELRLPLLEHEALFRRSVGDASDIVQKEMYRLEDLGGRALALRPEGTAGMVRSLVEHRLVQPGEERRFWYAGPMFRQERPQKGRQRQFHQIGVEVFGSAAPELDAEIMALNLRFLEACGVAGLVLRVNSIGGPASRAAYRHLLLGFLEPRRDGLCEDCDRRLDLNPLRVLDCKREGCQDLLKDAPRPADALDEDDRSHDARVRAGLEQLGVAWQPDPGLVRGLDYYSRTVFEIHGEGLGAQSAVSAGGRYDGLVAASGGGDVPAFGFAVGLERLLLVLEAGGALRLDEAPRIGWIALDDEARSEALPILDGLRTAGLTAVAFWHKGSVKAQMRAADGAGCRLVMLRGLDERTSGSVAVRDLADGSQQTLPLDPDTLPARLAAMLRREPAGT